MVERGIPDLATVLQFVIVKRGEFIRGLNIEQILGILQEEFPGITIYLVDLNEKKELVAEYIKRFDLKLEMILDRYGQVGKKYGVVDKRGLAVLPNTFVVSADGNIYYHHTGFKPGDESVYREKFVALTKQTAE